MKSEEEIVKKLNELCKKKYKERKKEYLKKCHLNCVYNTRHRVKGMGLVGFCHNSEVVKKNTPYVCSCDSTVRECENFKCKHTDDTILEDFEKIIKDPARAGKEYPKIAVLLWCLQRVKETEIDSKESVDKVVDKVEGELEDISNVTNIATTLGKILNDVSDK